MSDYSELKRLAEAATKGEWRAGNAYDKPFVPKYEIIVDTQDGPYVILSGNHNFIEDAEANIAFVGAANPAAVLALIAENERLSTQVRLAGVSAEMTVHQAVGRAATDALLIMHERDQLKAENEELRQFILGFAEYDAEMAYAYAAMSKEG